MKSAKPVAMQLYSLRNEMEKDFYGTLEQVAQMGYDGVEFCGFYDQPAEKIKDALDRLGLQAVSSHQGINTWINEFDFWADMFQGIGCRYSVIPYEPEEYAPNGEHYEERLEQYRETGLKLKEELGIQLFYHNHDGEFQNYKGRYGLDYMFEKIPELNPELDVCWIKVSGEDPVEYIRKYKGRAKLIHIKDYAILPDADPEKVYYMRDGKQRTKAYTEGFEFRPVGQGCQDMPGILRAAEECQVEWLIVEQDVSPDSTPLQDAQKGIDFMRQATQTALA